MGSLLAPLPATAARKKNNKKSSYVPPAESAGGWRSLVGRNVTPSTTEKAAIRETAGIDWDMLKLAQDYNAGFAADTTLLVIRNGWIAGEWGRDDPQKVASISKSLTGLTMMKIFENSRDFSAGKLIRDKNAAWEFLPPEWAAADARRRAIRFKHLLTMSSGLEPDDEPLQDHYLDVVLSQPVRTKPQSEWSYASLPVDLMAIAAKNITGRSVREVFNTEIARPIGIPDIRWDSYADGYTLASSEAWMSARDLARIGYLMLNKGQWGSRAVVSKKSFKKLVKPAGHLKKTSFVPTPGSPFEIGADSNKYYGYLWWLNKTGRGLGAEVPKDAFYARGYRESLLAAVPSRDLVVVRFGQGPITDDTMRRELMKRVMAALV
ncbi:serine hydrolase [Geminicoccaceae bacterium 1502E]|nr:serine hydrolase [Geminicoccaceae bacterium 1502E]